MFNSQLLCAANQPAGACGWCPRSAQLYTRSSPALRFQYGSRPSISASPCQAAERQHASAASSTGLEISRKHDLSESTSCREGPHKNRSQEIWGIEQLKQRHIHEQGHGWKAAQASLWHWEWGSTRWRASFFFLMASVAFVIGSAALLQPHIFAGSRFLASLFLEWPFALGSLSYLTGARLYKRAALEGYALQRRSQGRLAPVLKWARVEVLGTGMIVLGCELGSVSSCAPLLLKAFPGSISHAPLSVLEAWMSTALNTVAGALFVVGSYTILAGTYRSFAPQRVLLGPHARTLNFWGSAAYLVGSCGLLMGAIFAQPLCAVHPVVSYWLGQVVGYLIGSLWFVVGALAQIGDVAREVRISIGRL